jgi:type VI secretion system secreted protein VgrG
MRSVILSSMLMGLVVVPGPARADDFWKKVQQPDEAGDPGEKNSPSIRLITPPIGLRQKPDFEVNNWGHSETLGRGFSSDVTFTVQAGFDPEKLLGQQVSVEVTPGSGPQRFFNGYVSDLHQTTRAGTPQRITYQATIVPWLVMLSNTANVEVFQSMTVPQIVRKVFGRYPFAKFEMRLTRKYPVEETRVQYRETDLNFVNRLLEHVGIFCFFVHDNDSHTLVLVDDVKKLHPLEGQRFFRFGVPAGEAEARTARAGANQPSYLAELGGNWKIEPTRYTLQDFDFRRPQASDLQASASMSRSHGMNGFEMYDWPGEYTTAADAKFFARLRVEEMQSSAVTFSGFADSLGFAAGHVFSLVDHPVREYNRTYLVTASNLRVSSGMGRHSYLRGHFSAVPADRPFRPGRNTPEPLASGVQTAIVVGPKGKKVHVDPHGRILVRFHWERDRRAAGRTAWLRLAQPLTRDPGARGLVVPRVGQEVLVQFLEGDPDRPVVTAIMYNAQSAKDGDWPGGSLEVVGP